MAATRSLSSHCLRSPHSAPTARTFTYLHLATKRSSPRALPLPLLVLDFLAPAAASASTSASASRYVATPATRTRFDPLAWSKFPPASPSASGSPTTPRPLSTTPTSTSTSTHLQREPQPQPQPQPTLRSPPQTITTYNPRRDDNGEEMSIEITSRAARRLKEIMTKDANPLLALRVTVESGGCHGFQYLMSLTTLDGGVAGGVLAVGSAVEGEGKGEEDTVFEAGDGSGARVVMDRPSLELLKGSKIDYTTELIGSQFKIADNPLATSSCGCGTSFDIKI